MKRVIFGGSSILLEGSVRGNDDQARLDEISRTIDIQSSVTARKYNYTLNREDIAQHLWIVYLEKLQGEDIRVVNKALQNAAIDYARYELRRGNSTTSYSAGAASLAKSDKASGKAVSSSGSGDTSEFAGKEYGNKLAGDRYGNLDVYSRLRIQEMLTLIENNFGDGSKEYFYMLGEIARQGFLDAVKSIVHKDDYNEVSRTVGVSGRETGAPAIAKLMGVGTGSGSYRDAVKRVVNFLKLKKFTL